MCVLIFSGWTHTVGSCALSINTASTTRVFTLLGWTYTVGFCVLIMRTSFVRWLYFGQALASRHPLFFQWVTRERQREKELFLSWRFDLGLTRCWAAPACASWGSYHGFIEDVWNTFMETWVVANGQHQLCRRYLVWYLDDIMHAISCTKFIVSFIWRERNCTVTWIKETQSICKRESNWKENYFGGMAVFTFGIVNFIKGKLFHFFWWWDFYCKPRHAPILDTMSFERDQAEI